jgi:hypothetical protein
VVLGLGGVSVRVRLPISLFSYVIDNYKNLNFGAKISKKTFPRDLNFDFAAKMQFSMKNF